MKPGTPFLLLAWMNMLMVIVASELYGVYRKRGERDLAAAFRRLAWQFGVSALITFLIGMIVA